MARTKPSTTFVRNMRGPKGLQFLKDGDDFGEPCPECDAPLRARRTRGEPIQVWCPCGYVENATDLYEARNFY